MIKHDYTVVGFEYPTQEAAGEVFERAHATLTNCSIWRTATPELDRWFIIGLLTDEDVVRDFNWGSDVDYIPSEQQVDWMVQRRTAKGVKAALHGLKRLDERRSYTPETGPRIPGGSR